MIRVLAGRISTSQNCSLSLLRILRFDPATAERKTQLWTERQEMSTGRVENSTNLFLSDRKFIRLVVTGGPRNFHLGDYSPDGVGDGTEVLQ